MRNRGRVIKNMLIGMIGICICIAATWVSSMTGKGNVVNGYIQSNWPKMSFFRFEISIIMSSIGITLYYIGISEYIKVLKITKRRRGYRENRMAKLFEVGAVAGLISYLFIQVCFIMMALVYKLLYTTSLMGADIISVTEGMFYYVAIPVIAFYVISIVAVSIPYMYFTYTGKLKIPKLFILFNPLIFLGIGELLKLTKKYYLVDFSSAAVLFGFLLMMAAGAIHVSKMPDDKRERRRRTEDQ